MKKPALTFIFTVLVVFSVNVFAEKHHSEVKITNTSSETVLVAAGVEHPDQLQVSIVGLTEQGDTAGPVPVASDAAVVVKFHTSTKHNEGGQIKILDSNLKLLASVNCGLGAKTITGVTTWGGDCKDKVIFDITYELSKTKQKNNSLDVHYELSDSLAR